VAGLIAAGRTNREIAHALRISPKIVEAHLGHLYRKLGLRSRTELAMTYVRSGIGPAASEE